MDAPLLATLGLGFGLGVKHALDADHLVAICAIIGRERSLWKPSLVGAVWGLGHTASLFLAALAVIVLRVSISPAVARSLELCVGVMLVILGADLVRRVARARAIAVDPAQRDVGRRPFFVGVVHGLAGSAALTLFVLSTIASPWAALLYVLIFGAGTIAGMGLVSTLIGMPLSLASQRFAGMAKRLQLAVGFGSLAFGLVYAGRIAADASWLAALR